MSNPIKNKEMLGGIIFFVISLYLFYEIAHFPTTAERYRSLGPSVFPNVLSGALCALSIALFIQGLAKEKSRILSFNMRSNASFKMWIIVFILIVYMTSVEYIGFILWGLIFMVLAQVVLGERRPLMIAVVSGVVVGIVYVVFSTLLRVPLPEGSLFT